MVLGSLGHGFHFHDRVIGEKHGIQGGFSTRWGVGVHKIGVIRFL